MEKNLILTKAKGAVLSHDFSTAARLYKMLLNEEPSNVEYLKQLGSIYVQNHEDEKAIPYYQQIITFYPHYIEAMTSLGAIYRRLKRYDESIKILQRAIDESRDSATVYYNLGFTYKEMGNFRDAIEAFEFVIHENPDDVLAYNHLGSIYYAQKNYEKSINSYKRGLQIDQNHPILNYNLARVYETAKNIPDAIRCYQAALKTRPGWLDAIRDFSNLLINCQKNKDAQNLVQQSIKLHPTDTDLLCLLGRIYLNQYDYDSAEKTFKKADSYKQNDVKILSGLAEALEKGEKVDKALDTVLSALEIEPENKDIRKQYVHTLLTAQDYDVALSNIKVLNEETNERDPQVLDLYGQYYICKDEEEKAKKYFDKIQRINHHYKDYILSAANRFSQIKKYESAEKYANEFIQKQPQNPEGYNILGKIFENKGDLQKAIDSFNKSLSLRTPNVLADKKIKKFSEQIKNQIDRGHIPEENQNDEGQTPKDEPLVEEIVETQNEIQNEDDEEFDFTQMGDNVPLQEGLVENGENFFDSLDDKNGDLLEDEPQEEHELQQEENSLPQFDFNSDDDPDFSDFFDDDVALKENESLKNELKDLEDELEPKAEVGTQIDGNENQNDGGQTFKEELGDDENQNDEMQKRMQQMAFDNANHAIQAANIAQKTAEQVAQMQKKLQEQTEKSLQDALNEIPKVVKKSQSENISSQNSFVNSPNEMLEKINNILKDDDVEQKYGEEIELFKKLKLLSSYLPEEERKSLKSCRMNLLTEYVISKMSGNASLLEKATALLKSGVLGDEFKSQLDNKNEDFEITNEIVKSVLKKMRKLSENLTDKDLVFVVKATVDDLLERIEMEILKSQIF